MSIFDKFKKAVSVPGQAPGSGSRQVTFTLMDLPETLEAMQAMPEAALQTPFQTAVLTVCALCVYGADKDLGIAMLNWLKGPRPLSNLEISFLDDRFRDQGHHIPFSYFAGAVPDNDYTPTRPLTLTVEAGPYADANAGYKKLHIRSGGADSPREIVLRQKGDGQWLLWDQFLMVGIRQTKSSDPWA